jgi:hypothetical protein
VPAKSYNLATGCVIPKTVSDRPKTVDSAGQSTSAEIALRRAMKRYETQEAARMRRQAVQRGQSEYVGEAVLKFRHGRNFKAAQALKQTGADMAQAAQTKKAVEPKGGDNNETQEHLPTSKLRQAPKKFRVTAEIEDEDLFLAEEEEEDGYHYSEGDDRSDHEEMDTTESMTLSNTLLNRGKGERPQTTPSMKISVSGMKGTASTGLLDMKVRDLRRSTAKGTASLRFEDPDRPTTTVVVHDNKGKASANMFNNKRRLASSLVSQSLALGGGEAMLFDNEDGKNRRRLRQVPNKDNPFLQWQNEERERKNVRDFAQDDALKLCQNHFRREQRNLRRDISSRDNDWLYENRVMYCESGHRLGHHEQKQKEQKQKESAQQRKTLRSSTILMANQVSKLGAHMDIPDSKGTSRCASAPAPIDKIAGSDLEGKTNLERRKTNLDSLQQKLNKSAFGVLSQIDDTITKVKQDNELEGLLGNRFANVRRMNEAIRSSTTTDDAPGPISEQQAKGGIERLLRDKRKTAMLDEDNVHEETQTPGYVAKKRLSRLSMSHLDRVFDPSAGGFGTL